MGYAQEWQVVRENVQKSFHKTVPAGNYSGITHLHDDIYAVVSDKSDSALYFNFRIQVNPVTGDLEQVENLGYTLWWMVVALMVNHGMERKEVLIMRL